MPAFLIVVRNRPQSRFGPVQPDLDQDGVFRICRRSAETQADRDVRHGNHRCPRLDEADPFFEDRFGELVRSIFSDFERHRLAFGDYRRIIRSDKARFTDQARSFFFKANS